MELQKTFTSTDESRLALSVPQVTHYQSEDSGPHSQLENICHGYTGAPIPTQ